MRSFLICFFRKSAVFMQFRWFSAQHYIGKRLTCQAMSAVSQHFLQVSAFGKIPPVYKRQHGFSGHLRRLPALFSLPGDSPAASKALPATKSAPEKLRRTCQREKTGAGKKEDAGGLTPTKDDDAASVDFSRWQACCPLYTEGRISACRNPALRISAEGGAHRMWCVDQAELTGCSSG